MPPHFKQRFGRLLFNKIFVVAVLVYMIYTLFGFVLTPYLIRHYVPKMIRQELKHEASIGEVRVNPFLFVTDSVDRMNRP